MLQSFKTLDQLTAAFPDEETCIAHFRGYSLGQWRVLSVLWRDARL